MKAPRGYLRRNKKVERRTILLSKKVQKRIEEATKLSTGDQHFCIGGTNKKLVRKVLWEKTKRSHQKRMIHV